MPSLRRRLQTYRRKQMNSDAINSQPRPGLLLTTNLLFSSMVTGTAAANGKVVVVLDNLADAEVLCRDWPIAFIIIDLSVTEPDIATIVARLRASAGPVPAIAFGSHVDKERLDEARAAGCDEVMPRSRFSGELPALLNRYANGSNDKLVVG